ncbi:hypothetical protein ACFV8T_30710 [Streptomyces sp. NPDC059832]|uniref:hypothetical protein n=1 Tax=Streptomyces sp. NPDC059832 TaxID=3346966 RepID=UPI0036519405
MVHCGPATTRELGERIGLSYDQTRYRIGHGHQRFFVEVRESLFPSPRVVIVHQVLFGVYSGIVPDGIADLGVAGLDWAGDSAVLVLLTGACRPSIRSSKQSRRACRSGPAHIRPENYGVPPHTPLTCPFLRCGDTEPSPPTLRKWYP